MGCSSKKVCYNSPEEAEEALLQARAKYRHGPVAFYECEFCGQYHLTSKGDKHIGLETKEEEERIQKEQEARFWEDKFKG